MPDRARLGAWAVVASTTARRPSAVSVVPVTLTGTPLRMTAVDALNRPSRCWGVGDWRKSKLRPRVAIEIPFSQIRPTAVLRLASTAAKSLGLAGPVAASAVAVMADVVGAGASAVAG